MTKTTLDFRETPNPDILNTIRAHGSRDYREFIPEATQANMEQIGSKLNDFKAYRNEFMEALVNRIGLEVFRSANRFENPLAEFKQGKMPYGSTVEEIQTGLIKARVHDEDRDSLERDVFGRVRVDVQTAFHTENRREKYKVTIDDRALMRAFTTEFGVGKMVHELMEVATASAERDEFLLMANLLVENDKIDGFYKVHVDEVKGGDEAVAKALLTTIREYRTRISFISTLYNSARMPVVADQSKMIMITTPRVAASLDVDAYAAAFNIDRALIPYRVIAIPEEHWPIKGAQAILTDSSFFQVYDTYTDTTEMHNPDGLYRNYWLHIHQIISMSRFVPAILFTTEEVTPVTNEPITVSSVKNIEVLDGRNGSKVTKIERGYYAQVVASAVTNKDGVGEGVVLTMEGAESPLTTITNTGALMAGYDEPAPFVTVTATSVVDPTKSKELKIELYGDIAQRSPKVEILPPTPQPPADG